MEGEVKGKTYKMKGHTLPGINQRLDAKATNVAEQGLAGSSAFQQMPMGTFPGGAGNIAQGVLGAQGVGTGMIPPIRSKQSMAKKYGTFSKYKTFKK